MHLEVETLPYATITLHAVKYPSRAVYGLLLGEKLDGRIKVSGAVPLAHETSPLAPALEVALALVHARHGNIIGVYFANQRLKDKSLPAVAVRLAERIATTASGTPPALIIQLVNAELKPDCSQQCMLGHIIEHPGGGGHAKECGVSTPSATLPLISVAMQRKLYRDVIDFENHLDRPETDFYNGRLRLALAETD